MSFLGELKRRNVIRVAVLYFVSSWVLLQLTDVLSSLLPVPEWTGSFVFMMLLICLAPALIFSWVYEMTPDGIKREKDIDRSTSITPDTGKKINSVIVILLVLAITGLIADRLIPEAELAASIEGNSPALERVARNTIAVLPFSDLSAEGDQRFFTDGLSEELLNLLVRVDGLKVASRTTTFGYRGTTLSIPEISEELGVAHILEGSVRKSGDRIRITAQLIDAETDTHLWSENFDRDMVDIFAIQDEIGSAIVTALKNELGLSADIVKVNATTENVDAYALYLEARELFIKRESLLESKRLYQEAIDLDPQFARAWEGLAATEAVLNDWVYDDGVDHLPHAKAAADQALLLDPTLSMPSAVLGSVVMMTADNIVQGESDYLEAIEKDPKNTTALLWYGLLLKDAGKFSDSENYLLDCLDIDPGYQNCKQHLAHVYLVQGKEAQAQKLFEETLERNFHSRTEAFIPVYVKNGQRSLALTLADIRFGRQEAPVIEWIRAIENPDADNSRGYERLKDWEQNKSTGLVLAAYSLVPLAFGMYDEMLSRPISALMEAWHPQAGKFRRSPQFKVLIRDTGTLRYWQERGFPDFCRAVGDDDFECDELVQ